MSDTHCKPQPNGDADGDPFDPVKVKRFTLIMAIPPVAFWSFFLGTTVSMALGARPSKLGLGILGLIGFTLVAGCALALLITVIAGLPFRRLLLVFAMNLSPGLLALIALL